jgi:hypothetical protein
MLIALKLGRCQGSFRLAETPLEASKMDEISFAALVAALARHSAPVRVSPFLQFQTRSFPRRCAPRTIPIY